MTTSKTVLNSPTMGTRPWDKLWGFPKVFSAQKGDQHNRPRKVILIQVLAETLRSFYEKHLPNTCITELHLRVLSICTTVFGGIVKEIWPEKEKYTHDEVFRLFGNLRDFAIANQCCHGCRRREWPAPPSKMNEELEQDKSQGRGQILVLTTTLV